MAEAVLEGQVRRLCLDLDVIYVHHGRSVQVVPGWPDDVLVGHKGILYRELKTTAGLLSPEQDLMLDRLTTAGADAAVWRPTDLTSGRIAREIAAISRLADRIRLP